MYLCISVLLRAYDVNIGSRFANTVLNDAAETSSVLSFVVRDSECFVVHTYCCITSVT